MSVQTPGAACGFGACKGEARGTLLDHFVLIERRGIGRAGR
jgi:hypothetical protein